MENADAEAAEESRDKGVGRDEDEDEEQDHGTSDDKSSSANSHSEDSEVAAAGATPIRVYESGSDSVLSNDNTCATADASVTTTSRYYRSDYVVQKRRNKRSSLDLRKLPVSILLQPGDDNDGDGDDYEDDYDDESSLDHDDIDEQIDKAKAHSQANQGKLSFLSARNILQSTCLNARYKLKTQMMLSFGVVSFFTVGIVVFVGLITVLLTGQRVQNITHDTLQDLAQSIAGTTARYLADEWTTRFLPVDLVDILCRATQERFAGYPMDNDSDVPFRNIYYDGGNNNSNPYQYPIKGRPLPLDWQILNSQEDILLVTDDNHQEHVQKRWPWYQTKQEGDSSSPLLSTSSASFFMQGTCDPSSAPGSQAYFPNCKDINNNITSGGAIFADESIATNELIHRKASDLNPLLKALYEYHQDVKSIGLYFSNSGAGATVVFPHFMGGNSQIYNSSGCNWLLNTHPLDRSKTIASLDDFERCHQSVVYDDTNIHQRGNMVPERLYNPLDTDWCPKQAMEPDSKGFHVHGPYLRSNNGGWQLSLGRAIYDPVTQEFIACTSVDFMLSHIQSILQETVDRSNGQLSHLTIVKYNSEGQNEKLGEVVASTNWNLSESNQTVTIDELQIGVRQEDFQTLHDLVDFSVSTPWDPSAAKHAYESFMLRGGNMSEDNGNAHYLVAAHPLPPIPDQYSPDYEPEFLVIVSIREEDFLKSANLLSDTVDEKVADLLVLIFVVGGVGFILMTVILFMVAQTLTTPLNYMNEIAADIMHSYGDYNIDANANIIENGEERDENGDEDGSKKEKPIKDDSLNPVTEYERTKHLLQHRCGPKTELSDIVAEFLRMVREFSGKANAKTDQQKVTEIENRFNLMEDFKDLYASREGSCSNNFKYTYTSKKITNNNKAADLRPEQSMSSTAERENPDSGMNMSDLQQPQRLHFGRIIIADDETKSTTTRNSDFMHKNNFTDKRMTSPLFFWVVVLIVTPLLVTTVTISTILMVNIARHFPDFIDDAKDVFIREEIFALRTYVDLKASLTASTTMRAVRDLHVLSRYASWLVFGGLNFSDSHTYLTSGVEQCKAYSDQFEECPYFQELSCNLADRRIQSAFYVGESHDTNVLGNRNITSYPKVSFMPETTAWWYNVTAVPGAEKGRLAGGYETTFDRLRSASAIPVFQLLYNYEFFGEQTVLGSFVAFEDDGLFVGYLGCEEPGHVSYSSWHSNVDNGAADLRPELCPLGMLFFVSFLIHPSCLKRFKSIHILISSLILRIAGKFGYDPRCRSWYDKGSKATGGNASFFYATPPYLFAATNTYAQSGSSPLIEPRTGKHVGQTLIDFNSQPIIDSLSKENFALTGKGFPILITIESDNFGADTVIGPGREEEAKPIADLVLANDPECIGSACKEGFFKIVEDMKLGKTGTSEFSRVSDEGSIEAIYISYAPVIVKSFAPTDSTDFDRGVVQSDYVLYSLAFAQPEEDMLQPFGEVERDIEKQFYITLIVLCTTIALATAFVFYFSHAITVSMTEPMFYLLELIHHINQ